MIDSGFIDVLRNRLMGSLQKMKSFASELADKMTIQSLG
jgi:hypothetical protein